MKIQRRFLLQCDANEIEDFKLVGYHFAIYAIREWA